MGLNFNKKIVAHGWNPIKNGCGEVYGYGEVNWIPINISLNWHCGGE